MIIKIVHENDKSEEVKRRAVIKRKFDGKIQKRKEKRGEEKNSSNLTFYFN